MKDEPVIINKEEIDDNGKEYIKLLGIRNWCKRDSSKYALPKLPLLSSNEIFLECLEINSIKNNLFRIVVMIIRISRPKCTFFNESL